MSPQTPDSIGSYWTEDEKWIKCSICTQIVGETQLYEGMEKFHVHVKKYHWNNVENKNKCRRTKLSATICPTCKKAWFNHGMSEWAQHSFEAQGIKIPGL